MRIGSNGRTLEFRKDSLGPHCFRTQLIAPGISAEAIVDFDQPVLGRGDIAGFLADLADNWKGWNGEKRFETTELEFSIVATHDGKGHISFAIVLKEYPWSVKTEMELDVAEIERAASEAKGLFGQASD